MRSCSAWRMSGRLSRVCEGRPAGTTGRLRRSSGLPLAMAPGIAAEEYADRVLLLADQLLEQRHGRLGRPVLRFRLAKLQLGDKAPVKAKLE